MPIYEYLCRDCGHRYDLRQGFDVEAVAECPDCCGLGQRQFTPPLTILYKGKGWRTTQYEFGKDYFGLQRELKGIAERTESRRGSYEDRLERQQKGDERADQHARQAQDFKEHVARARDLGPANTD